jgi:outer membrane protein insertion porin family
MQEDTRIVSDSVSYNKKRWHKINEEEDKYYFGNIKYLGNTVYRPFK